MFYVRGYVKNNLKEEKVVIFKQDVRALTRITNDMLEVKSVSINGIHPQSALKAGDVVGLFITSDAVKGETVLKNKLASAAKVFNGSDNELEPDERIIAISTDLTKSIGGTVSTGDEVDLIAVLDEKSGGDPQAKTIVQHVKVVDVRDQNAKRIFPSDLDGVEQEDYAAGTMNKKLVPGAVLLSVKTGEAEKIVLYQKLGEIYLSENPRDSTKFASNGIKLSQIRQGNLMPY